MSTATKVDQWLGTNNMTLDLHPGTSVAMVIEVPGCAAGNGKELNCTAIKEKVSRVHIYTPFSFKAKFLAGGAWLNYECTVHPELTEDNSLSDYPKYLSKKDFDLFKRVVKKNAFESLLNKGKAELEAFPHKNKKTFYHLTVVAQ